MRLTCVSIDREPFRVSIHAPSRGATGIKPPVTEEIDVSIHAPSRGATCEDVRNTILVIKFQSTHPHGVRPTPELMPIARTAFQSTHPHGVRLWPSFGRCCECRCFNPRTLTGCDTGRVLCGLFPFLFQSTHPHGVRRWRAMRNCVMHMFQSTHPHGVRLVLYGPATGIAWRFNPRTLTGCDY